jgi:arylformamidase
MAKQDESLSRRSVLSQAAAGAAMIASGAASAQPAPAAREKGPLVWMNMDQKELDDSYDQAVYAPNRDIVIKRCVRNSELARERLGAPKRFSYGPTSFEGLDVFTAKTPNAPIMMYIHGGSWRVGTASQYHYLAEAFLNAGANIVIPDFANVGDVGGSLLTMADQIRRSVAWVYKNARSFGGDPERIYVSGQSSGGHWIGVLMTTDWQKDYGVPMTIIKGGASGSGMYDLKPVRLSKRSEFVKFTDETEEKLSAQRHLDKLVAPMALVYGSLETPEFQRQSRDFFTAVKAAGKPVTLSVMEGYNHFEVMESIGNPLSLFGRAAIEVMKLRPA